MPRDPAPIPMEALLAAELPEGPGWQYEPKWDGFRCIARREGDRVEMISRSGKPLGRYFPEVVERLGDLKAKSFTIDGELILPLSDRLDFEALQMRLHPAESRIRKLAKETPAQLMLFDMLQMGARSFDEQPLAHRRAALEKFYGGNAVDGLLLSPATTDRDVALGWLKRSGGALDGVVAKRLDQPYRFGERAMVKVKQLRTADCVVGGFRYAEKKAEVGSLLLGLYDDEGLLHHVGFTSAIAAKDRPALTERLEALIKPPGFTGNAPGGPSRWATERSAKWQPLKPKLVVEVRYDQVTGRRFRHGTALLRWRPDKSPKQCTFEQLAPELKPSEIAELFDG
ncbi:MAG: ATP-dependent DNA ligase [Sphingomonas sp.]|nr:ATP-dependent DNA ligase [Sphingomonas sp.]